MKSARFYTFTATVTMVLLWLSLPVLASAAGSNNSTISRSYSTEANLRSGTIVSIAAGSTERIEATNTQNSRRILGVVVNPGESLVSVDPDAHKTPVALNGVVNVLVSTVNGTIAPGERIAASPLSGIGMKSVTDGYIIGRAQAAFNAQSKGAAPEKVTDKSGKVQTIAVGYVAVRLSPGYNGATSNGKTGLQRWVSSLTGRAVSIPRIIASVVIAVVTLAAIIVLMYAAIYGSIISIGRNPLAHKSIIQALAQVVAMVVLAVGLAFVLIYFLLR